MAQPVIYHNPRCSKSRQTLKLLESHGFEPVVIDYLKKPPSNTELKALLKKLKLFPRDILRKKEEEYKKYKLDDPKLSDDKIIQLICKYPKLLERPIVTYKTKAALGRPPENVETIL